MSCLILHTNNPATAASAMQPIGQYDDMWMH